MKNLYRVLIIGILTMAVTFAIAFVANDETALTARFWIITGPILLGELLIALSVIGLIGKKQIKSFPLQIAAHIFPWFYLGFTLVIAIVGYFDVGDTILMILQLVGLLFLLIPIIFCEMIGDAIDANAVEQIVADSNRMNFRFMMAQITDIIKLKFPENAEILKLVNKCQDSVRYAADSVAGSEEVDSEVERDLNAVNDSLTDAESLKDDLALLLVSLRKREALIKTLR